MAISLNKVTLIGNVGKDPEVRSTQDGREVASFTLATSDSWKDKTTGEKKEKTEWHRIVIFSQPLVTLARNYVKKGSKLYIEGALHTRKWTDQSGVERTSTEIVIQSYNGAMMMLDSRGGSSAHANESSNISREPAHLDHSHSKGEFETEHLDDEIPF
jgi:single-strand DNA-binding protein